MNTKLPNYLEVIAEKFPNVGAYSVGPASVYDNLVYQQGDALPTKAALDAAALEILKDRVWEQIKEKRTAIQNGGVFVTSINKWFDSDQTSRIQQLGLVMMGASMPSGIMWKTMDNTFVEMTPAIALQIFNAVAALDMQAFAVAEQHKAAMLASAQPGEYNFTTNWPAVFPG